MRGFNENGKQDNFQLLDDFKRNFEFQEKIQGLTQSEVDVSFTAGQYQHIRLIIKWKLSCNHRWIHWNRHEELDSISVTMERQLRMRHATFRYTRRCKVKEIMKISIREMIQVSPFPSPTNGTEIMTPLPVPIQRRPQETWSDVILTKEKPNLPVPSILLT